MSQVLENASSIWKMLDEMAENDPVGYKSFVGKQLEAGSKLFRPPHVRFVVEAKLQDTKQPLFVHYCDWTVVPESKAETSPVMVKCSATFDVAGVQTIAMAFNPTTFDQHKFPSAAETSSSDTIPESLDRRHEDLRYQLVWLGLHYLENEKQLITEESRSVTCSAIPIRPKLLRPRQDRHGTDEQIRQALGYHQHMAKAASAQMVQMANLTGVLKPNDATPWTDDLQPVSPVVNINQRCADDDQEKSNLCQGESIRLPTLGTPKKTASGKLIEEVNVVIDNDSRDTETNAMAHKITWTAEVISCDKNDEGHRSRPNQLRLAFNLPGVSSGNDCDLDLNMDRLTLSICGGRIAYQPLDMELPCRVDIDRADAKFNVKHEKLFLTAPILQSD